MSGSLGELHPHARGAKPPLPGFDEEGGHVELHTEFDPTVGKQRAALGGDVGIDVLVTGVRGGKSLAAAYKMLRWCLERPRRENGMPTKGLVLGSDYNLVRRVQLEMVLEHARNLSVPYDAIVQRVVSGNDPRIYLWNGTTIYGRSGTDPDRLRGYDFDFFWGDEVELMPERAFSLALERMGSAEGLRGIITSSPAGPGWLWRLVSGEDEAYAKLRANTAVRILRWRSADNHINRADVLASVGAALEASSPGMSRQELDGLFLGTHEAPGGGPIEYAKAFVGRINLSPAQARAFVVGVDLGKSEDFTWFTVLSREGVVLEMHRFNLGSVDVAEDDFWIYARKRLLELVTRWHASVVVIDTARGGDQFLSSFRQDVGGSVSVAGYATDAASKKTDSIEALGMAISLGKVRVPTAWTSTSGPVVVAHAEDLRLEFKKLLVSVGQGGRRRYTHPPGGHDDGIVSLALAWQALADKSPEQRDWSKWKVNVPLPQSRWGGTSGHGPWSAFGSRT